MKPEATRLAAGLAPAILASCLAAFLSSCTSAGDTSMDVGSPALTSGTTAALAAADREAGRSSSNTAQADQTAFAGGDAAPAAAVAENSVKKAGSAEIASQTSTAKTDAAYAGGLKQASDADPAQLAEATPAGLVDGNKRQFLSSFLGKPPGKASPLSASAAKPLISSNPVPLGSDSRKLVQLASADPSEGQGGPAHLFDGDALPGVRQTMLFEIKRKSGIDDESDVDLNEEDGAPRIRMASAAGMARLAPNGLLKQNDTVDTACLKPALVAILRSAEQHFGQKAMITSGYRDPSHNRRVRGAKNSMHMYCAAADVQMSGVSKWQLANYFRAMPGRGGVGTYCHTESVHVDIGPERDWNWKCGRRG